MKLSIKVRFIRKFGTERASTAIEKVFEDCIHDNGLFEGTNLYPFMIAASLDHSEFSVVYYLLKGEIHRLSAPSSVEKNRDSAD